MASISFKADAVSNKAGDSLYLTKYGSGVIVGYIPEIFRKDIERGRRQLVAYYLKDRETIQHLRDSLDKFLAQTSPEEK